jgi:hypothetical protein
MEEVFPVGSGVVLGLVIACLVSGRLRGWVLAVGSVLIGATAAWVTGELAVSWLYLLVDIGQVLVAGALTWTWPCAGADSSGPPAGRRGQTLTCNSASS